MSDEKQFLDRDGLEYYHNGLLDLISDGFDEAIKAEAIWQFEDDKRATGIKIKEGADHAYGKLAIAEGFQTTAAGNQSHAEGYNTYASGHYSHAEGITSTARGQASFACGEYTLANEPGSHAEGGGLTSYKYIPPSDGSHDNFWFETLSTSNSQGFYYNNNLVQGYPSSSSGSFINSYYAYTYIRLIGSNSDEEDIYIFTADPNFIYTLYTDSSKTTLIKEIDFGTDALLVTNQFSNITLYYQKLATNKLDGIDFVKRSHTLQETLNYLKYTVTFGSVAYGQYSHAEGSLTYAGGKQSHAEGYRSSATGSYSHAEGESTVSSGGHSEGSYTYAHGGHAEGSSTTSLGGHAEGSYTYAYDGHAEGINTTVLPYYTPNCIGGSYAKTYGNHSEGCYTYSAGGNVVRGCLDRASTEFACAAHAEGAYTSVLGSGGHAEGGFILEGHKNFETTEPIILSESTQALIPSKIRGDLQPAVAYKSRGNYYYIGFGQINSAEKTYLVSFPYNSSKVVGDRFYVISAVKDVSVTMWYSNSSSQQVTWTNGIVYKTVTTSNEATDRYGNKVYYSDLIYTNQGTTGLALGYDYDFLSNFRTLGRGAVNMTEFLQIVNLHGGNYVGAMNGHAEGFNTYVNGKQAHAEGYGTYAMGDNQHVQGKFNIIDNDNKYAFIIGNGTSNAARSNAFAVTWDGQIITNQDGENVVTGTYASAEGRYTKASGDGSHTEGLSAFSDGVVASAIGAHAEGYAAQASITASGSGAHAEGFADGTPIIASGNGSHAEGSGSSATGAYSHAEGAGNIVSGTKSHVEGAGNNSSGNISHVEGAGNILSSKSLHSHMEGAGNTVFSDATATSSHIEGVGNAIRGVSSITNSHIGGARNGTNGSYDIYNTLVFGANNSFVCDEAKASEYQQNHNVQNSSILGVDNDSYCSSLMNTHISGTSNVLLKSNANDANIEGTNNVIGYPGTYIDSRDGWPMTSPTDEEKAKIVPSSVSGSHIEGKGNIILGAFTESHLEGNGTTVSTPSNSSTHQAHVEGGGHALSNISYCHVEGDHNTATNISYSHIEGFMTTTSGFVHSHIEGVSHVINGGYGLHIEGYKTTAAGGSCTSHSEGGYDTKLYKSNEIISGHTINGVNIHVEGSGTKAGGDCSHTEGLATSAIGMAAHSEGCQTYAGGFHKETIDETETTIYHYAAHAEGMFTTAAGEGSHAEGFGTIANATAQHVQGKYNIVDNDNKYVTIVGNGYTTAAETEGDPDVITYSNAHTLDWSGNAWYAGDVTFNDDNRNKISLKKLTAKLIELDILSLDDILFTE